MPMPNILTDLAALFTSRDFGEDVGTVLWNNTLITGAIFDDEDVEVQMPDGQGEIIHQAMITGQSAQFVGIREKDPVVIRNRQYKVNYWKDDGTGVIEIYLVKA